MGDFGRYVTLRDQVREFHVAMGQPCAERPTVIPDDRVRLRAALISEEFFETLRALFGDDPALARAEATVRLAIDVAIVRVDMVALSDGLGDLNYVEEGTRLEFGIDGEPIAAEIHRANMAKADGPVAPNGKRLKPPGWTPPDIAGVLKAQGWKPEGGT